MRAKGVMEIPDHSYMCPICLDHSAESGWVYHERGGELHPLHKKCLEQWLKNRPACPVCRIEIDFKPIVTFSDQFFNSVKFLKTTGDYFLINCVQNLALKVLSYPFLDSQDSNSNFFVASAVDVVSNSLISAFVGSMIRYDFSRSFPEERAANAGLIVSLGSGVSSIFKISALSIISLGEVIGLCDRYFDISARIESLFDNHIVPYQEL